MSRGKAIGLNLQEFGSLGRVLTKLGPWLQGRLLNGQLLLQREPPMAKGEGSVFYRCWNASLGHLGQNARKDPKTDLNKSIDPMIMHPKEVLGKIWH